MGNGNRDAWPEETTQYQKLWETVAEMPGQRRSHNTRSYGERQQRCLARGDHTIPETMGNGSRDAWPEETTQYQKLWGKVAEIQSTPDFLGIAFIIS
jgi:hypothetical protein